MICLKLRAATTVGFFVSLLIASPAASPATLAQSPEDTVHRYYAATLAAAEKSIRLNESDEVRRWLSEAPEDVRGWEWRYLTALTDESLATCADIEHRVTSLDVAAAADLLVTGDVKGNIILRRLSDFAELRRLGDHSEALYSVRLSPDGMRLLTVSRDTTSRVIDIATGTEVSRITLDNPGVAAVEFSPTGKLAATCTWLLEGEPSQVHGVVRIWNPVTGEVLHRTLIAEHPLDSMAWTPDGKHLLVGCWDGTVYILDQRGSLVDSVSVPDEGIYTAVVSVAVSPDGRHFACGSKDRTARVWRFEDRELVATLSGHAGYVNELRFLGNRGQILTASVDGTLRTWEAETGKPLQILRGHHGSVDTFAVTDNGTAVISTGRDHSLRLWDITDSYGGGVRTTLDAKGSYTVAATPDGKHVVIAMYDGRVVVLDARTAEVTDEWTAHDASCNLLSLSGDGSLVLTCSWDKTAKLWRLSDHELITTMDVVKGIYGCALSSDGSRAALWVESTAELRDAATGELMHRLTGHDGSVTAGTFTRDGKVLVTASDDRTLRLWNVDDGTVIAVLEGHASGVQSVAIANDGTLIASGDSGGVVQIRDASTYEVLNEYAIGRGSIPTLAFSNDGGRLAAGSNGVSIIDPHRSEVLLSFWPQMDNVYRVSFSADDQKLLSCTTGGSIVFSDTVPTARRRSRPSIHSAVGVPDDR